MWRVNGVIAGQTRCGARLFYGGGERQWRTDRPPPTRPVSTHASDEEAPDGPSPRRPGAVARQQRDSCW
ncbi:hypothetical protein Y032_0135g1907 [Ancylostoma ceylanicum]|uniref:Uncharacterized protein n=1 Tax=Ancylostoma ceylanicum TaxID=53326 RepID=A0A016T5G1_9BILA|nr:hypothetical protein Y032_0135g1907 [Ancylostoma ceylanicum]